MNAIQYEFNFEDQDVANLRFACMQNQIDTLNESNGKVRRRLFSEMGEIKKVLMQLRLENESLKREMKCLSREKVEWLYCQDDLLVKEA